MLPAAPVTATRIGVFAIVFYYFEVNFLRILFERNYRVQRFSKIEPNLEALFLKLTKFAWKDEQNKA